MNIRNLAFVAIATLALASCSPKPAPDSSTTGTDPQATAPSDGLDGLVLNPNAADPDFCALVASENSFDTEASDLSDQLSSLLDDSSKYSDPETIATMHETGARLLAVGGDSANYYYQIAAAADDPAVAEAFTGLGDLMSALYSSLGQAAVDATSVEDYMTGFLTIFSSEEVTNLSTLSTDWTTVISDYSVTACS